MAESGNVVSRIGQFKVGPNIGEGTFGLVKLGTHIQTHEKVAIKVLEKVKIASKEDLHRVRREIKILKSLRHPNIIQLYEIIEDMENIYLIMEYASKGELFNYIVEHTKLQETEACRLYQQIISAMEYFHRLNIAHRDLKPENLFLDDNCNIKVGDFGLSNYFGSDFLLKTSCGSPCYAAPEMISDRPYSGITVDIWASGVVLYAMLCGYLPFNYPEDQTSILFKEIRKGNYKIPNFVSKDARHLIKNILNIDNRTRFTISQIKSHPWYTIHPNYGHQFPGVIVGVQAIPIDNHILNLVTSYGYDAEQVRKDLSENRHNSTTSLYYLILSSQKRLGYVTKKDICSKDFVPEHLVQTTLISTPAVAQQSPLRMETVPQHQVNYQPISSQGYIHYHPSPASVMNTQQNLSQVVNHPYLTSVTHASAGSIMSRKSAAPSVAPVTQPSYTPMLQIFSSRDSSREHSISVKAPASLNNTVIKEPQFHEIPHSQPLYMPQKYAEKHSSAKEIGLSHYGLHPYVPGQVSAGNTRTIDVQLQNYGVGTTPQKIVVQTMSNPVELYDRPLVMGTQPSKVPNTKEGVGAALSSTEANTPALSPVEKAVVQIHTSPLNTGAPRTETVPAPEVIVNSQPPSRVTIEAKIPVLAVTPAQQPAVSQQIEFKTTPDQPSKTILSASERVVPLGLVQSEKKPSALGTKPNIYNKVEINFITNNFNSVPGTSKQPEEVKKVSAKESKPTLVAPIYASSARVLPQPMEVSLCDSSQDDRMFLTQRTLGANPTEDLADHPALLYNPPTKVLGTIAAKFSGETKRDDTKFRSLVELGPSKDGSTKGTLLAEGTKLSRNFASILGQAQTARVNNDLEAKSASQLESLVSSMKDSITGISRGFNKRKQVGAALIQASQPKLGLTPETQSSVKLLKNTKNFEIVTATNTTTNANNSGMVTPGGAKITKPFAKPAVSGKRLQTGNILRGITIGGGTPAVPLKKRLQNSILNDYSTGGDTDRKTSNHTETGSTASGLLDQIRQKHSQAAVSLLNVSTKDSGEQTKAPGQGSFKLLNLSGNLRRPSMNTSIGIRKTEAQMVSLYQSQDSHTARGLSLEGKTSVSSQKKSLKPENSEYLGLRSSSKGLPQPPSQAVPPVFKSEWSQERKIWINSKPTHLGLTTFMPASQILTKVANVAKQVSGTKVETGVDYTVRIPTTQGQVLIQIEEIEDCPNLYTVCLYSDPQGIGTKVLSNLHLDD